MTLKRYFFYLFCTLGPLTLSVSPAADDGGKVGETLPIKENRNSGTTRQTAMPELEGGRLAKILTNYYVKGLGGPENWAKISSLKYFGKVELKNASFDITAYQRKPNLVKMILRSNQGELVVAHNGKNGWKQDPGRVAKPKMLEEAEERRLKHNAQFASHLLYPYADGKTIQFVDTVPAEGTICHQVRVTLNTGYQTDYYIDIRTSLIVKAINHDLKSDSINTIVYKNYTRDDSGMPVAMLVESFENGELISTLKIDEVQVNAGVFPFMFQMRLN